MRVSHRCIIAAILTITTETAATPEYSYSIQDAYLPGSFFDKFDFFTDIDPTHGFVQYVNSSYAQTNSLIGTSVSNGIYIGVDHENTFSTTGTFGVDTGRPSVRLQSKNTYTHGLFVLSLNHMPYGCGAWPAFWTLGTKPWPSGGEIDILENVNTASQNLMSLHTSQGCTIAGQDESGTLTANDCWSDGGAHVGCSVQSDDSNSFGSEFNGGGGGIYAMEWTSDSIKIWNWQDGHEPADIDSAAPNPGSWGQPAANFQGSCDIDGSFQDHMIVFDMTFCGDWAGATYSTSSCAQTPGLDSAGSCVAFVAQNPSAFQDTYWDINYLKVYQQSPAASSSSSSSSQSPLSSVSPILTASSSLNIGLGASTTETKPSSATVVIPPQTSDPTNTMSVSTEAASGVTSAFMYTLSACVANNVIPTNAASYDGNIGTAENCAQYCYASAGDGTNVEAYVAMALANGQDCYCFDEPAAALTTTDGCTLTCSDNGDEMCGGTSAVDFYVLSDVSTSFTAPTTSAGNDAGSVTDTSATDTSATATQTGSMWIASISSSTPALPTVTDPAQPADGAYFQDTYGNKAQIFANAKFANPLPVAAAAFGHGYTANDFTDCLNQCNDYNYNAGGWNYIFCRGIAWYNGTDQEWGFGTGYSNCQFIADGDCFPQGWNSTNFCGDHSGTGFYETDCANLSEDERGQVVANCSDCTGNPSLWSGNPDNPNIGASCQSDYDASTWTVYPDDITWSHYPDEQPYSSPDGTEVSSDGTDSSDSTDSSTDLSRRQNSNCAIIGDIQSDTYSLCQNSSLAGYYVGWYVTTRNYLDDPEGTDEGDGGDDGSSSSDSSSAGSSTDTSTSTSDADTTSSSTDAATSDASTTSDSMTTDSASTDSQSSASSPTSSGDLSATTTAVTTTADDGVVQVLTLEIYTTYEDRVGAIVTVTSDIGSSVIYDPATDTNSQSATSSPMSSSASNSQSSISSSTLPGGASTPAGTGAITTTMTTTNAGGTIERIVEVVRPTTVGNQVLTVTEPIATSVIYDPDANSGTSSPSQIITTDANGSSITLSFIYVTTCAPPELASTVIADNTTAVTTSASTSPSISAAATTPRTSTSLDPGRFNPPSSVAIAGQGRSGGPPSLDDSATETAAASSSPSTSAAATTPRTSTSLDPGRFAPPSSVIAGQGGDM